MMGTRGLTIAATCLCLAMGPAAACIDLDELMPPSDPSDSGPVEAGPPDDSGPVGGTGGDSGGCTPAPETCNGLDDDCDGVDDDDDPDTQVFCEGVVVNTVVYCGEVSAMWLCVPGPKCYDGFFSCDGEPSNGCEPYCDCHDCPDSGSEDGGADDAGEL
jgi:hypothetical protein